MARPDQKIAILAAVERGHTYGYAIMGVMPELKAGSVYRYLRILAEEDKWLKRGAVRNRQIRYSLTKSGEKALALARGEFKRRFL